MALCAYRNEVVARFTAPPRLSADNTDNIEPTFTAAADKQEVANLLTAVREYAGFSKRAFAKEIGTGEGAIRSHERGDHYPTLETLKRYAEAAGMTVTVIFEPTK